MDPNATLKLLRDLTEEVLRKDSSNVWAVQLAGTFEDLDQWLSRGGFLPAAWQSQPIRLDVV